MRVKLYREHKYVSYALSELEKLIAKTDFTDDEALNSIQNEWQRIKEMLEGHADHEEQNIHALLHKKGSTIHHEAHNDHDHLKETLISLQHLLDTIKTSPDRIEAGYQFYLAYRKFVGDNLVHLHDEETQLLPELQRLCTDEELRAIEHPTYELMTAEEMVEMVLVLFPHMNFSDKCAFLTDIKLAQPQKFQELWSQANRFLNTEEIKKFQHSGWGAMVLGFDMNNPKIKERTIAKNNLAFSFLTHMPIVPGHSLICPIRCVEKCEDLTHDEWKEILELKHLVCNALKKTFHAEGFNFAWNMGENAGQTVPHFHLHVVPRKLGDTGILHYEPRVFLYRPGSRAISPSDELQQTAELIRNNV